VFKTVYSVLVIGTITDAMKISFLFVTLLYQVFSITVYDIFIVPLSFHKPKP